MPIRKLYEAPVIAKNRGAASTQDQDKKTGNGAGIGLPGKLQGVAVAERNFVSDIVLKMNRHGNYFYQDLLSGGLRSEMRPSLAASVEKLSSQMQAGKGVAGLPASKADAPATVGNLGNDKPAAAAVAHNMATAQKTGSSQLREEIIVAARFASARLPADFAGHAARSAAATSGQAPDIGQTDVSAQSKDAMAHSTTELSSGAQAKGADHLPRAENTQNQASKQTRDAATQTQALDSKTQATSTDELNAGREMPLNNAEKARFQDIFDFIRFIDGDGHGLTGAAPATPAPSDDGVKLTKPSAEKHGVPDIERDSGRGSTDDLRRKSIDNSSDVTIEDLPDDIDDFDDSLWTYQSADEEHLMGRPLNERLALFSQDKLPGGLKFQRQVSQSDGSINIRLEPDPDY